MTSNCDSRRLYALCTSTELADAHQGMQQLGACLWPVARSKLNQRYDDTVVQDCVQEALVGIWKCLEEGNGPKNPGSFLALAVRITQNKCIDRVRYEQRRPTEPESSVDAGQQAVTNEYELPEHYLLLDEERIDLITRIRTHKKLSDKSKTILVEGFLFEKTDVELARVLKATEGNVRLTRHRNLKSLRNDENFMAQLRAAL